MCVYVYVYVCVYVYICMYTDMDLYGFIPYGIPGFHRPAIGPAEDTVTSGCQSHQGQLVSFGGCETGVAP